MWHRRNWNIVYPWLELDDTELADLSTHGTYVAGFTDPAIEGRTDLYDLFVNGKCSLLLVQCHAIAVFEDLFDVILHYAAWYKMVMLIIFSPCSSGSQAVCGSPGQGGICNDKATQGYRCEADTVHRG